MERVRVGMSEASRFWTVMVSIGAIAICCDSRAVISIDKDYCLSSLLPQKTFCSIHEARTALGCFKDTDVHFSPGMHSLLPSNGLHLGPDDSGESMGIQMFVT